MSKTYKGYELVQAIAEGKIKEGSKFIFRYKNVAWNGRNFYYIDIDEYLLKGISDCEFIFGTFELIEDEEIDIQAIENINAYKLPENGQDFYNMSECHKLWYYKIDELIKAIKQLDKRIKQ